MSVLKSTYICTHARNKNDGSSAVGNHISSSLASCVKCTVDIDIEQPLGSICRVPAK